MSTHVFIIGLSLAEDDFIIRSFLVDNLPGVSSGKSDRHVVVVNPDANAQKNYAFAPNIDFRCQYFDLSHIEEMQGN